jgi:hypothetical protein
MVGANAIKGIKAFHDFIPSKKRKNEEKSSIIYSLW